METSSSALPVAPESNWQHIEFNTNPCLFNPRETKVQNWEFAILIFFYMQAESLLRSVWFKI